MVGVPYLSLGICGFLIYRGCKMNAAYLKNLQPKPEGDSGRIEAAIESAEVRHPQAVVPQLGKTPLFYR
jgi:hypothetical protein